MTKGTATPPSTGDSHFRVPLLQDVDSQIWYHLALLSPAVMRVVSRRVICGLSQIRVISSDWGWSSPSRESLGWLAPRTREVLRHVTIGPTPRFRLTSTPKWPGTNNGAKAAAVELPRLCGGDRLPFFGDLFNEI
jgi:hypothetical protein